MGEIVHTLVVCGLVSGTQPLTLMGLFLILGSAKSHWAVWSYLAGTFVVQLIVVLAFGFVISGTVDADSQPGRGLVIVRVLVGVALVGWALWLHRPPKEEKPETPPSLERLRGLGLGGAFVAGVALADYQGSMLAAGAIATADLARPEVLKSWVIYAVLATGIPAVAIIVISRSAKARVDLERAVRWVLRNRRMLAKWICLVLGMSLITDGLATLLTTG